MKTENVLLKLYRKINSTPGPLRNYLIEKQTIIRFKNNYKIKSFINHQSKDIVFGFNNSLIFVKDGIVSSQSGDKIGFNEFLELKVEEKIWGGSSFLLNQKYFDRVPEKMNNSEFQEFKSIFKSDVIDVDPTLITSDKNDKSEREKRTKEIVNEIIPKLYEIDDYDKEINRIKNQLKLKSQLKKDLKRTIQLVKLLNNLPNQTYGSVIFYNELNKNSTLFDNSHLNKITRFLNFIETHEDKYLRLYDQCVGLYIDDPNNNCFNELINKLETINHYYEIMKSLIHNVNKDKVLYNKLYNLIEDEGIFMTKNEKESLNYLRNFSKDIMSLKKNITDGFNKLTTEISSVSFGLYDLDESLGMINSSLDDIYMNLPDKKGR